MVDAREVYDRAQAALEAIGAGDRFAVRRAVEALEVARDFCAALVDDGIASGDRGCARLARR